MSLTRRRWFILALAAFVNLFAGSIYAWSVFAAPLAEHLSRTTGLTLTAGNLAIAFSLANAVGPIPLLVGGWVTDRFGPRPVMVAGGLLVGLGYWMTGAAESLTAVLVGYGLFFGIGLGLVYGCTVSNTVKFFPDHRGLAGGVTTAAYGLSSAVIAPAAAYGISELGVTASLQILGILTGVVAVAGGLFSARCPDGFTPDGGTPVQGRLTGGRDVNWPQMVKSPVFWPMLALLLCGAVSGMMILSHAQSIGINVMGLTAAAAATGVACLAFANTAGRLAAGVLSDYLGRTGTLALALAASLTGLALLALASTDTVYLFYAGLAAVGLSLGAFMGVYPGFTAQEFGTRHNSVNFALMFMGFAAAGTVGPALMNQLQSAGFAAACGAAALIAALGFVFIGLYRKLKSA